MQLEFDLERFEEAAAKEMKKLDAPKKPVKGSKPV